MRTCPECGSQEVTQSTCPDGYADCFSCSAVFTPQEGGEMTSDEALDLAMWGAGVGPKPDWYDGPSGVPQGSKPQVMHAQGSKPTPERERSN